MLREYTGEHGVTGLYGLRCAGDVGRAMGGVDDEAGGTGGVGNGAGLVVEGHDSPPTAFRRISSCSAVNCWPGLAVLMISSA